MEELVEVVNKTPIEIALQIDDDGFTTARKLYAWLELDISHYSRWSKVNILENPYAEEGVDYSPCMASKGRGNFADDYRISATFAKKISMMTKTERGEQARDYFIGCEQVLVKLAEQKHKTELERAKGIAVRQALTKAIQQSTENERMHGHAYSNYTNCIYKVLFGKNAAQLRSDFGIGKTDSLRDCFSKEELIEVEAMERLVSGLVDCGWGYQQVKDFIAQNNAKQLTA